MRPAHLCLALGICLASPGTAFGASFGLAASYWDSEDPGQGLGLGIRAGIDLLPQIELEVAATYFSDFDQTVRSPDLADPLPVELRVLPLDVGIRLDLGAPGGIYLAGGGSLYFLEGDRGELDEELGLYASLGYRFARLFFLEITYRDVEGTLESLDADLPPEVTISDRVDVDLTGLALSAGVRW